MWTEIIPQHPGYVRDDAARVLWAPIPSIYLPPTLHDDVYKTLHILRAREMESSGRIIGKHGKHLKRITEQSGAMYIFLMEDTGMIEIWGTRESHEKAKQLLTSHIHAVCSVVGEE